MQPAGLTPSSSVQFHPLHSATAFMAPTAAPSIVAGGAAGPLAVPSVTLQDRLQSHYATSTSYGAPLVPSRAAAIHAPPPVSAALAAVQQQQHQATAAAVAQWAPGPPVPPPQPPAGPPPPAAARLPSASSAQPPAQLLASQASVNLQQPFPQQQHPQYLHPHNPHLSQQQQPPQHPQRPPLQVWPLSPDLAAALPPGVQPPLIRLPPPCARSLPEDAIAGFCSRLAQNRVALAVEEDALRRTERDLQEATAVLRRAEQLPKLTAAVWSYLDENDVICGPYSLLQLMRLLKGAPQTCVESSESGESLPFVDALAATPLRSCVLERNTLRERLAAQEAAIWRLLEEGRLLCLEIQEAEFNALADRLAAKRWLPAGGAASVAAASGLTPPAVRTHLIGGGLAPDAPLVPAALACASFAAAAAQGGVAAATEVVAEWESAVHEALERRRAVAAAASASGVGALSLQGVQPPARDARAWTYISNTRPAGPFSFQELSSWLEAGQVDAYTLVWAEQPLRHRDTGKLQGDAGDGDGASRWILLAELVRLYGSVPQGLPPGQQPAAPMTSEPDPMFALGGLQQTPPPPLTPPPQQEIGPPLLPALPPPALAIAAAAGGAVARAAPQNGIIPPMAPAHACLPQVPRLPVPPLPVGMQVAPLPRLVTHGSLPLPMTSCGSSPAWPADGGNGLTPMVGTNHGAVAGVPAPRLMRSPSLVGAMGGAPSALFGGSDDVTAHVHRLSDGGSNLPPPLPPPLFPNQRQYQQQQQQQQQQHGKHGKRPKSSKQQSQHHRSASPQPRLSGTQHKKPPPPQQQQQQQEPPQLHTDALKSCPQHQQQQQQQLQQQASQGKFSARAGSQVPPPPPQGVPELPPPPPLPAPPPPPPSQPLQQQHQPIAATAAPSGLPLETATAEPADRLLPPPPPPSRTGAPQPHHKAPLVGTAGSEAATTALAAPAEAAAPRPLPLGFSPAVLAQSVRMTKLQFLQYMRPHLHKLLSPMVEDAYCDFRLRQLELDAQSQSPPQSQQQHAQDENAADAGNRAAERPEAPAWQRQPLAGPGEAVAAVVAAADAAAAATAAAPNAWEAAAGSDKRTHPAGAPVPMEVDQAALPRAGAGACAGRGKGRGSFEVGAGTVTTGEEERAENSGGPEDRVRPPPREGAASERVLGAREAAAPAAAALEDPGRAAVAEHLDPAGPGPAAATDVAAAAAAAVMDRQPLLLQEVPAVKAEQRLQQLSPGAMAAAAEEEEAQAGASRAEPRSRSRLRSPSCRVESSEAGARNGGGAADRESSGAAAHRENSAAASAPRRPRRSGRLNTGVMPASATIAATEPVAAGAAVSTMDATIGADSDAPGKTSEILKVVHDMLDEILMLALFTIEAQSYTAPARATRSRRQATAAVATATSPTAAAAAAGGNKGRRDGPGGFDDASAMGGHQAKRQRTSAGASKVAKAADGGSGAAADNDSDGAAEAAAAVAGGAGGSRRKAKSRDRSSTRSARVSDSDGEGEAAELAAGANDDEAAGNDKHSLPNGPGEAMAAAGRRRQERRRPAAKRARKERESTADAAEEAEAEAEAEDRMSPRGGDGLEDTGARSGARVAHARPLRSGPGSTDGGAELIPIDGGRGGSGGTANSADDAAEDHRTAAAEAGGATAETSPRPPRPPRHRGISAKEFKSLADGTGGLLPPGDPLLLADDGRGRRTRAAVAAAAVHAKAALAAEVLASMCEAGGSAADRADGGGAKVAAAAAAAAPSSHAARSCQRRDRDPPSRAAHSRGAAHHHSPVLASSDAAGGTADGDDVDGFDSPFRHLASGGGGGRRNGSGGPQLQRAHRSLDGLAAEAELASWQAATAAGRASRRGSDSGRRPPSRTSSCTQEHLEGLHSVIFPGELYGKAVRHDSLTMLLEAAEVSEKTIVSDVVAVAAVPAPLPVPPIAAVPPPPPVPPAATVPPAAAVAAVAADAADLSTAGTAGTDTVMAEPTDVAVYVAGPSVDGDSVSEGSVPDSVQLPPPPPSLPPSPPPAPQLQHHPPDEAPLEVEMFVGGEVCFPKHVRGKRSARTVVPRSGGSAAFLVRLFEEPSRPCSPSLPTVATTHLPLHQLQPQSSPPPLPLLPLLSTPQQLQIQPEPSSPPEQSQVQPQGLPPQPPLPQLPLPLELLPARSPPPVQQQSLPPPPPPQVLSQSDQQAQLQLQLFLLQQLRLLPVSPSQQQQPQCHQHNNALQPQLLPLWSTPADLQPPLPPPLLQHQEDVQQQEQQQGQQQGQQQQQQQNVQPKLEQGTAQSPSAHEPPQPLEQHQPQLEQPQPDYNRLIQSVAHLLQQQQQWQQKRQELIAAQLQLPKQEFVKLRKRPVPAGGSSSNLLCSEASVAVTQAEAEAGGLDPQQQQQQDEQRRLSSEEPPARPWAESSGRLRRRAASAATIPASGAAAGAGAMPPLSRERYAGSYRTSPTRGSGDTERGGGGASRSRGHRALTPMSGCERSVSAGPQPPQPQHQHQHQHQQSATKVVQRQQRGRTLRQLQGEAGCCRGLPLPALLALAPSRNGVAAAAQPGGGAAARARAGSGPAAGSDGSATAPPPPPHSHPRARAAASEHRFLTAAAGGGMGGGGGGPGGGMGGGGGVSAEQQREVMEEAKWRLLAARAKKLKFGRSRIAGWGLFAVEPIEPSEFVIEYCGQLIRKPLDDVRQRQYDAAGYADYMFALDDSQVVDATLAGNAARFINHCCDPNCVARIVEAGGRKRIAIYTLRRIEAGEELHYDYKLSSVPGAQRVPCGCGARNCKGFMN